MSVKLVKILNDPKMMGKAVAQIDVMLVKKLILTARVKTVPNTQDPLET